MSAIDEYRKVHESDRREIAQLEGELFDLKCGLADARGDVDTLKRLCSESCKRAREAEKKFRLKWKECIDLKKEIEVPE